MRDSTRIANIQIAVQRVKYKQDIPEDSESRNFAPVERRSGVSLSDLTTGVRDTDKQKQVKGLVTSRVKGQIRFNKYLSNHPFKISSGKICYKNGKVYICYLLYYM